MIERPVDRRSALVGLRHDQMSTVIVNIMNITDCETSRVLQQILEDRFRLRARNHREARRKQTMYGHEVGRLFGPDKFEKG